MSLVIERLSRAHDRAAFDCGEPSLNQYLQRFALQNDERHLGRTFVLTTEGEARILGYYTLATGKIAFENLPLIASKKLPPHLPIPVILLGRLAVDESQKGKGLGKFLLFHALRRSVQIAEEAGVYAIEVDALNDEARDFYLRYGFAPLADDPLHLYLSIKDVEALGLDFSPSR